MSDLTDLNKTRMRVLRNGIYHSMRRRFYERTERLFQLAILLLGAASVPEFQREVQHPRADV